mmetsp:Transcript_1994/g.5290  ORF Transcript_1994/g.5290 Transcript_1994/m.5290 type:complete len:1447 (-) Transcript_1994:184-4524(-)
MAGSPRAQHESAGGLGNACGLVGPSDTNVLNETDRCIPRAISERGARELWAAKRQVEEYYGRFWEDDPRLDITSEQYDREAFMEFMFRVERDAGLETGGIGLAFRNLTVRVPVEITGELQTVDRSALAPVIKLWNRALRFLHLRGPGVKRELHSVLDDVSGYVNDGECMLILAPPGSGVSTLIKMLSLRTDHHKNQSGSVLFNGVDAKQAGVEQVLRHAMRVVGQEDIHFASLTVLNTLQFASECLYPEFLPYAEYARKNKVVNVGRGLGIERVFGTPVGDANLRGVSGGEKKRVTIGEMLVGYTAKVHFLDSFNKGLDSAATLDIVRAVSFMAKSFKRTFVISLQQPGAEMLQYFDRLLVLDAGKVIYFGEPDRALGYFESLGFVKPDTRSIPDFIATVADPKEFDLIVSDGARDSAPRTVDDFARRYRESVFYEECEQKLNEGVLGSTHVYTRNNLETKLTGERKKIMQRPALNSRFRQLNLVLRRGVRLELRDKRTVVTGFMAFILIGLILGTLFLSMPLTFSGAYSRNGLLFLCLTFVALSSMGTIGKKYGAKKVFLKQTAAGMYQPGPFVFSSTFVDAILLFFRVLAFSVCVYFLCGFNRSATRFMRFVLVMWLANLSIDSFIRVLSTLFEQDVTTGCAGACIVVFVIFSGYLIPRSSVPPWFIWAYWISPMRYAFEAIAINEFYGLVFSCTPEELLPPDPSIPESVKICPISTGEAYATNVLGLSSGYEWYWYNIAALVGFIFLFLLVSSIGMLLIKPTEHGYRVLNSSSNPDDERIVDAVNEEFYSHQGLRDEAKAQDIGDTELSKVKPGYIVWKGISYTVPTPDGDKKLLDNVDGFCRPGRMIALMGSSGAGKTTMLDVIAQRKTKGSIDGIIEVNRRPQDQYFSRISGYVEQMDLHYEKLTVRESLEFSARLRLPQELTDAEVQHIVERTLDALLLRPEQDRMVGAAGVSGLSSEARKRLTIGVELVANPSILFLDEPTSGLDSRAALVVTRAIRNVANLGCAVICTIHQPSIELFNEFDELLLLQRGGQTVYFGELGPKCSTLVSYFERNGAEPMEPGKNPADYMLLQIGAGLSKAKSDKPQINWNEVWKASPENSVIRNLVDGVSVEGRGLLVPEQIEVNDYSSRFATSRRLQMKIVIKRAMRMAWRTPEYNLTRIMLSLFQSIILGFAFFQLDFDQEGSRLIAGVLFLSGISGSMAMSNVIAPLMSARPVFYRELASGLYSEFVYHAATGLAEVPFVICSVLLFATIYYFLVGLQASRFGYFLLANLLFSGWAVFCGQTITAFASNITVALGIPPLINTLGNVLAGFLIRKQDIPPWYIWIYWINPFQYYNGAIMVNTLSGTTFVCSEGGYVVFRNPDPGSSCSELSNESITYLEGPEAGTCMYCPITQGDQILSQYGLGEYSKWINIAALFGFVVVFRILGLIGVRFFKHLDR